MAIIDLQPSLKITRYDRSTRLFTNVLWLDHTQANFPLLALQYSTAKQGGCRELTMTLDRDVGIEYGDRIQLRILNEWVYGGIVNRTPKAGTATSYNYHCYGMVDQLNWQLIKEFKVEMETLEHAVSRLHRNYIYGNTMISWSQIPGLFEIPSTIGSWDTIIDSLYFEWKYPMEILEVLRQLAGPMEFGVDWDSKFYFRMKNPDYPADERPTRTWVVGKGGVSSFTPTENPDGIINKIYLDCGTLSVGTNYVREYEEEASTALNHGTRESRVTLADSFPIYKTTNVLKDLALTVEGLDSATGLTLATDDDPDTCFDSNEVQEGGPVWYSKLGSAEEITSPEIGEKGATIHGTFTYGTSPGGQKFGNAVEPSGGYMSIPLADNGIDLKAGTLSVWIYIPWASASYPATLNHGLEVVLDLFETRIIGGGEYSSGIRMMLLDSEGGSPTVCVAIIENSRPTHRWTTDPIVFDAGWHHLQFAWDAGGSTLGTKIVGEQTKLGAVTWFDGVVIQRLTKTWSGWQVEPTGLSLHNQLAGQWFDDLQIYDYPKGDADGRDVAGGASRQRITCTLPAEKNIGRIVINSESEEDSDHAAGGILVEVLRDGAWVEVYRDEDSCESYLDIHINPDKPSLAVRLSLIGSSDETFRIYSLEAYEFAFNDVDQYAASWLADNAYPKESAGLAIQGSGEAIVPRGRVRVFGEDGAKYNYAVSEVSHSLGGNTYSLKLGDIAPSISNLVAGLNRKVLEAQYQAERNTSTVSSGEGMQPNSIGPGAIDHVLANQITAGILKSQNYVSGSSGVAFLLNEAKVYVFEEDGLEIIGGGGVNVSGAGSSIRGGQSDYNTGTGFWMGDDGGVYKFSVGEAGVYGMTVDDSGATFLGSLSAGAIDIGGADATSFHVDTSGNLWLGAAVFNLATNPFAVSSAGSLRARDGEIAGWTISGSEISVTNAKLKATGVLSLGTGTDAWLTAGRIYIDGPGNRLSVGSTFSVDDGTMFASAGTVGGWTMTSELLTSDPDLGSPGARVELDKTLMRISIYESSGASKVVMGYLEDLPKNDGSGNWGSNDYGFWARSGDNLVIDGDVIYESGDWVVENDASVKIYNASSEEIIRLGTDTGEKGLFLYDTSGDVMAKFTGEALSIMANDGGEIQFVGDDRTYTMDIVRSTGVDYFQFYPDAAANGDILLGRNRDYSKTAVNAWIFGYNQVSLGCNGVSVTLTAAQNALACTAGMDLGLLYAKWEEAYFNGPLYIGSGITATASGGGLKMTGELTVGGTVSTTGGYANGGATITSGGAIQGAGNLVIDGTSTLTGKVEVGGGYGSTGIDLEANGDIQMDGDLTVGDDVSIGGDITDVYDIDMRGTLYLSAWNIVIEGGSKGIYLGDSATNGTWFITTSGDDLIFMQREGGSYVLKHTFSGA